MKVFWRIVGAGLILVAVNIGFSAAAEQYGPLALGLTVVAAVLGGGGYTLLRHA
jgi:hypothetical protein